MQSNLLNLKLLEVVGSRQDRTTEIDMAYEDVLPVTGCTLSAGDFQVRRAWIAGLNQVALLHYRRDDLRLEFVYAAEAREQVEKLVQSEQVCCGFLAFAIRVGDDGVHLVIEMPKSAREVADELFASFCARAQNQTGCACCGGAA